MRILGRFSLAIAIAAAWAIGSAARGAEPVIIQGSNQLEYSINVDPDKTATDPEEIFEDWFDTDIRFGSFMAGFRYEAFLPPFQSGPDSLRQGITQRYAEASYRMGSVRVGNFYEIFGRGLLFRSYEERPVGVDSNMDGVLLRARAGPFEAKALTGRVREFQTDERSAVLRGADLGLGAGGGLALGASYLIQSSPDPALAGVVSIANPRHIEAVGGRVSYTHDYFDVYYEGGRVNRLFLEEDNILLGEDYDDLRGTGHYAAVNLFPFGGLSITAEYKEYNRFRFQPVGASDTDYNNPPAVTREPAYTLISRHPHQLNADDEKGYEIEAVASPVGGSVLTVSRAETNHIRGGKIFHEWYAEWRQTFGDRIETALVYDFIDDAETRTKNHTPVFEMEFFSGAEWSVRGEYQYQETTTELGMDRTHYALVEYHPNLDLSFSLVGEHVDECVSTGGSGVCGQKSDDFLYGQVDWFVTQDHQLTLTAGKRQGGFVCVGGVCREVPELQGVEFKLVSTF